MNFSISIIFRAAVFALIGGIATSSAIAQNENGNNGSVANRIDPTDFTSRIEIRNEYQDEQGGGYTNLLISRFDYAVSKSLALRLEVPVVTHNRERAGFDSDTGIGNILTRISWRAAKGENYAVVTGSEFILDTATEDTLGSGKHVMAPFAFASIKLDSMHSVFFPFFQHYFTIGGDDARRDVHFTTIKPVLLTIWPNRFFTVVEGNFIVNHERADKLGLTLEGELGRFVRSDTMIYARPGVGLHGDDVPQVYNWNFEVGLRYLFR